MKRVLLTGATGFVGANLARRLLHEGHEVHLLVRPGYLAWRIAGIRDRVHLHEVNMANGPALKALVQEVRPHWVFHLAAHGAYSSQTNLHQMVQTNLISTINLVEACLETGFESFINTGSSSEYGFKAKAPSEQEWLEPNSYYAVTKASATLYCRYIAQSRRVPLATVRLYSVYGPYEEPTRLMPSLILKGLQGALPPLVNPDIARDYIYTEDVNDAFLLAAARPAQEFGAIYNLGTGVQTSLREVVAVARRVLNVAAEPAWGSMPNRNWDTSVWVSDSRKIRADLGWQPRHSFEDGFRKMVDWFRAHPELHQTYRGTLPKAG